MGMITYIFFRRKAERHQSTPAERGRRKLHEVITQSHQLHVFWNVHVEVVWRHVEISRLMKAVRMSEVKR